MGFSVGEDAPDPNGASAASAGDWSGCSRGVAAPSAALGVTGGDAALARCSAGPWEEDRVRYASVAERGRFLHEEAKRSRVSCEATRGGGCRRVERPQGRAWGWEGSGAVGRSGGTWRAVGRGAHIFEALESGGAAGVLEAVHFLGELVDFLSERGDPRELRYADIDTHGDEKDGSCHA